MLPLPADLSNAATSGRLLALPLTADFTSSCAFPGTLPAVSYPCIATSCARMHLHSCGLDNMDPTNVQDHTKLTCILDITPGMRTLTLLIPIQLDVAQHSQNEVAYPVSLLEL